MNENLNLVEILKDCPKGTKLYSPLFGEVELECVKDGNAYPIRVLLNKNGTEVGFTLEGTICPSYYDGECVLFPSKEEQDWSKFRPKKRSKFDPNTLKPFDKVLTRGSFDDEWYCNFFSHCRPNGYAHIDGGIYGYCIPYNEDTKHLVGTNDEAPEFYRY